LKARDGSVKRHNQPSTTFQKSTSGHLLFTVYRSLPAVHCLLSTVHRPLLTGAKYGRIRGPVEQQKDG
jgi:hypothetical protein